MDIINPKAKLDLIRKRMGLTRVDFSSLCGFSEQKLQKAEKGEQKTLIEVSRGIGYDILPYMTAEESVLPADFPYRERLDAKAVGNRVREFRKSTGLTAAQFAEKLGVALYYYYSIESGGQCLSKQMARRIENAFGVEPDYFFYGKEEVYPINDRILEFLKGDEELRKLIWEKYEGRN